ncbi:MAG TPA: PaaI family thioesterase [Streptosporangiaceae bacterium]|nr:PaaI family thioesterase [Streptosporangiaceae bacterium]
MRSPGPAATLGDGEFAPTLELKVSFLRPAAPGRITGTGRVVHRGGSVSFLAGELRDETCDPVSDRAPPQPSHRGAIQRGWATGGRCKSACLWGRLHWLRRPRGPSPAGG